MISVSLVVDKYVNMNNETGEVRVIEWRSLT